jgi:hypothetical protein
LDAARILDFYFGLLPAGIKDWNWIGFAFALDDDVPHGFKLLGIKGILMPRGYWIFIYCSVWME